MMGKKFLGSCALLWLVIISVEPDPDWELAMLDPDLITREDLYEAIWSEAVQKVAEALGISDVGLAKICKKLDIPRPGRGYWTKSPRLRKVLKKPLPPLKEGQACITSITVAATEGVAGWTREALKTLSDEGIHIPTSAVPSRTPGTHPLITCYRDLVTSKGWAVRSLVKEKACLALAVSEPGGTFRMNGGSGGTLPLLLDPRAFGGP